MIDELIDASLLLRVSEAARLLGVYDAAISEEPALADTIRAAARMALDATELQDELRACGGQTGGLPTGEVTFLFGDIQGSTPPARVSRRSVRGAACGASTHRLRNRGPPRRPPRRCHGGRSLPGLSACARRSEFGRRAHCATVRDDLAGERLVRVRIGLHTGSPELTRSGYVGLDVHRAARIMALAHGGQILASEATVAGFDRTGEITIRALGRYALRGVSEPLAVVQIAKADREHDFPPPSGERVG